MLVPSSPADVVTANLPDVTGARLGALGQRSISPVLLEVVAGLHEHQATVSAFQSYIDSPSVSTTSER